MNEIAKVLVVDDMETNRLILQSILEEKYEVVQAVNGRDALDILSIAVPLPELILLDIKMPEMDGFETLNRIKSDFKLREIPVIFITAETAEEAKGLSEGAVDYIVKPFDSDIVLMRVATHIELAQHRHRLEQMVADKAAELLHTKDAFLETMADLIECRSAESGQHVKRTKELSGLLVMQLLEQGPYIDELRSMDCEAMVKAVPLHDIGKISIPDNILLKPGKLTPEEFEIIKTHTTEGGRIIDSLIASGINDEHIRHCRDICLNHHEKWDGSGYPAGISGTAIPLSARILAIVDVYDALVSERVYKKAMPHEKAVEIIKESSGSHFDPAIVDAFLAVQEAFRDYEES